MINDLKILALQTDIVWEQAAKNRALFGQKIENQFDGHDLVLLPETFNTGFPIFPSFISEPKDGESMQWMAQIAEKTNAVVAGTLLVEHNEEVTNCLVWMRPDGSYETYHKRHVFSMAGEHKKISPGNKQLIVELKGWKIKPMICYDLRFPVWSKNRLDELGSYEYDLAFYLANWPAVRAYPWQQLLIARAIENLAYVIGLNRVGENPDGIYHSGNSMFIDPKGQIIEEVSDGKESLINATLSYQNLVNFRSKFNVGPDWDEFSLLV